MPSLDKSFRIWAHQRSAPCYEIAGVEGIEPPLADLESAGLPLTDTPKNNTGILYLKIGIWTKFIWV